MKLKIFVLCHKDFDEPEIYDKSYMKKVFTKDCHNRLDKLNDVFYYETYSIYDVFENINKYIDDDTEYIGFCHYRRYFKLNYNEILNILENKDVILLNKLYCEGISVKDHYNSYHDNTNSDINLLRYIIKNNYKDYLKEFDNFFNSNYFSPCNMFITKIDIFKQYINFVFPIIDKFREYHGINTYTDAYKLILEQRSDLLKIKENITDNDFTIEYKSKIGGFMIERLMNIFFIKNFPNTIQYVDYFQYNKNIIK